jgi:hypothetical protein
VRVPSLIEGFDLDRELAVGAMYKVLAGGRSLSRESSGGGGDNIMRLDVKPCKTQINDDCDLMPTLISINLI